MKRRKRRRLKLPKGVFSKIIVVFCILEMTFMQVWSMRIASHNAFSTAPLIQANHGVFGTELLLLCLKRIFAKSDEKEIIKNEEKE